MSPAHKCQPPVGGLLHKSVWKCHCDKMWQVKKKVIFAYDDDNYDWFPAGAVVRLINYPRRQLAWQN